jgi:hypothetical protein
VSQFVRQGEPLACRRKVAVETDDGSITQCQTPPIATIHSTVPR